MPSKKPLTKPEIRKAVEAVVGKKRYYINFELYARGKRRKESVSVTMEPGIRDQDMEEFDKFNAAAKKFCEYLIRSGEL